MDTMDTGDSQLQAGEGLYWSGSPNRRRVAWMSLPVALLGIPFAGFALFWMRGAYAATRSIPRSSDHTFARVVDFFPLFGLPCLLIALSMILVPLWVYLKSLNTICAITSQRVMIISGRSTRAVKSLTPADILGVDYRKRPDGAGNVLLRTTGLPSAVKGKASTSLFTRLYGVPNVPNVAEQIMRLRAQALKGAPAHSAFRSF